MGDFEKQKGVAFIILSFTKKDEIYYIPFRDVEKFWDRAQQGGKKSFSYDEVDRDYLIPSSGGVMVHYLETLQKDLCERQ